MCITASCPDPTAPGVWWREDDRWVQYGALASALILDAVKKGVTSLDLSRSPANTELPKGRRYLVDLQNMQQVNQSSRYKREIRIIQPVVKQGKEQQKICKKERNQMQGFVGTLYKTLGRKLLEIAFDKLCTDEVIMKSISRKADSREITFSRKSSKCIQGEDGRDEFLDAMQTAVVESPSFFGGLIDLLKDKELTDESEIQYVFFGTKSEYVECILTQGKLGGYQGRPGFNWFGLNAKTSLPFCSGNYPAPGSYKLLVFLVILPAGTSIKRRNGLRVESTRHAFPLVVANLQV